MGILNASLYVSIAIFYNLFIHTFTSIMYKDEPFKEKYEKTTLMLLLAGIFGLVLSKLLSNMEHSNYVVSMGLGIGGILLILTAIFASWENVVEEVKVGVSGALLIVLIIVAYKYFDKQEKIENK